MRGYPKGQKETALKRMMPPENWGVAKISEEMGIPTSTLYLWRRQAQEDGLVVPGDGRQAEHWSSEEKFRMVLESAGLAEAELSAYCRQRGVYAEQIEAWRQNCLNANESQIERAKVLRQNGKVQKAEIKALRKELNRKEKALAEAAALLVLRKKMAAIWGEEEDV